MPVQPQLYLKAYRVNPAQSQIIFGIAGSNVNVVTAVTVSSGGTYTSAPTVSFSGSGGAFGTAVMGINSVSITPALIPAAVTVISVTSATGSGAVLLPVYGGPDISVVGSVYMNPNSSPAPSVGISSSPGSGATYQMSYEIASITLSQGSPPGAYSTEPTITTTPSGGASLSSTYGYAGITKTTSASESDIFALAADESPPGISLGGDGVGATATVLYRPILFNDDLGIASNLYWHTSDPAPTVSQVSGWATGSGSSFTPKFGIHELQVDNVGSGYDDTVDILANGETIATIGYDGANELDPSSITITQQDYGYFNASAFPGSPPIITLSPRGNGSGGAMSVSKCRLKRIEATGGTNYTASDMVAFQSTGRLSSTNFKNSGGSSVSIDSDPVRMTAGQAYSVAISAEGSGYQFGGQPEWTNSPDWRSISNGAFISKDQPSLSSTKRLGSVAIISGGSFTTPPSFSVSAPATGNAPTITLNSVRVASVSNTARGTGYPAAAAISGSGFFSNSSLSASISTSSAFTLSGPWLASIQVSQPGSNYLVGDVVQYGYGSGTVQNLRISSITLGNNGIGYTIAPSVSFSGGGQTIAASATTTIGLVGATTSALPLLSLADANLSTGDARKIAYAFADAFFGILSSGTAGIRATATRTYSQVTTQTDRSVTYRFSFLVNRSGGYDIKDET